MHEILEQILKTKDLAKAGDLFSISDEEIEKDCSEALSLITEVIAQTDYVTGDGVQSVVEICMTRITSAIRETDSIEKHVKALVSLLKACLNFDLQSSATTDSPHAKLVSDVLSCVFQNYTREMVMEIATPVTVLFLEKNNPELTRNITSYLSLAVINHAHLVTAHVDCIIRSIATGNKALIKLLSTLYDVGMDHMCDNVGGLMSLLSDTPAASTTSTSDTKSSSGSKDAVNAEIKLDTEEQEIIMGLLSKMCAKRPKIFIPHLSMLADHLSNKERVGVTLSMFEQIARESPQSCLDFKEQLMEVARNNPTTAPQVARIMGKIGRMNEVEAEECIDYLGNQLGSADTSYLPVLLQQLLLIGQKFPGLLKTHMDTVATFGESKEVEVKRLVSRLLELLSEKTPTESGATSASTQPGAGSRGSLSKIFGVGKRSGSSDKVIGHHHHHGDVIVRSRLSPRPPSLASASSDHILLQEQPLPDPINQFCEKHLPTIRSYIDKLSTILPLPVKCTVEEKKKKKSRYVRLYFSCTRKGNNCLYPVQSFFTIKSKLPRLWIHLMFLNLQSKSPNALRQEDSSVTALCKCWECLQLDRSDSFVRLTTASFPSQKEQQSLRQELWEARFFDVITLEPVSKHWSCFMCNNPEKLSGFIKPDGTPGITGQLKEKKGKWKLFKRWKKRYFTLSGDHITYQKTRNKLETLNVSHIESVRACRRKPRDVPRAFEIFTDDGATYKFKSNDHKNVERWVQCLNLALSKQQRKSVGRYHTVS